MNPKRLLLSVVTLLCFSHPAMSGKLLVKHNGNVVYSVNESGDISFVQSVQELSTTPVGVQGLILNRSAENLLWTAGFDQVNIKGQFIDPVTDTASWIMFRNSGTGKRAAVTDEGNIPVAGGEQNLVREDKYLDDHIIQNDISGNSLIEYCNFDDGRIEYSKQGDIIVENKLFYIKDHLGSTRVTEKANGGVAEFCSYDAYGAIIRSEISAGIENPTKNKFTGKEYDTSGYIEGGIACGLKLDYFGARYYDPELGIWTAVDPAGQLFNSYQYCAGNPILAIDPDGQWSWIPVLVGAGIGGLRGLVLETENRGWGFFKGMSIGALSGAMSNLGGGSFLNNVAFGTIEGGISGGLWAWGFGGNIGEGIWQGAAWGAGSAASQSFIEMAVNAYGGKGWYTNEGVFQNMVADANQTDPVLGFKYVDSKKAQAALDFYTKRFGGPALTYESTAGAPICHLSGKIEIPPSKFKLGSDVVKRSILHETGHYNDINWKTHTWKDKSIDFGKDGVVGYNNAIHNSGKAHIGFNAMKGSDTQWGTDAWNQHGFSKWFMLIPQRF